MTAQRKAALWVAALIGGTFVALLAYLVKK
jgi:hypothetical protein